MISALIAIPLIGALLASVAPQNRARTVALAFDFLAALLALTLWRNFDTAEGGLQFVERYTWIPAIGAEYLLGIDGFSLLLVLLTSLVVPFALLARPMSRGFCALMLLTQAALYGTFTAQNFILWFLFFEMSLIPSFLLIKLWGGEERDRAAVKFFVYTFLGSVAMLLAFLGIYLVHGTFDFAALATLGKTGLLNGNAAWLAFAGNLSRSRGEDGAVPISYVAAGCVRERPVGATMVLSGLLSKMGVYGFVRLLLPMFPNELQRSRRGSSPWLFARSSSPHLQPGRSPTSSAWSPTSRSRTSATACSACSADRSISLTAADRNTGRAERRDDAGLQPRHHRRGAVLLRRPARATRGSRGIADFGGLMQRTPLLCGWMSVAMFSFLGLPGLNGFIGEFLIFKGSFAFAAAATSVAVFGLLITAVALLRGMQALFSGPLVADSSAFADLRRGELSVVVPVSVLMLAIGIAPQWVFNIFNATVVQMARALA
jgi:NADH-quinone oxidoreductase subunit M